MYRYSELNFRRFCYIKKYLKLTNCSKILQFWVDSSALYLKKVWWTPLVKFYSKDLNVYIFCAELQPILYIRQVLNWGMHSLESRSMSLSLLFQLRFLNLHLRVILPVSFPTWSPKCFIGIVRYFKTTVLLLILQNTWALWI